MFPIILEHWTEVNQGILVHMWLDPVCHLILITIAIKKLSCNTLLSFSLNTTWVFKAFRLARYSFLLAFAGESAFLGVPLTLKMVKSSISSGRCYTMKHNLHRLGVQIQRKTYKTGFRSQRILQSSNSIRLSKVLKMITCGKKDLFNWL